MTALWWVLACNGTALNHSPGITTPDSLKVGITSGLRLSLDGDWKGEVYGPTGFEGRTATKKQEVTLVPGRYQEGRWEPSAKQVVLGLS